MPIHLPNNHTTAGAGPASASQEPGTESCCPPQAGTQSPQPSQLPPRVCLGSELEVKSEAGAELTQEL